MGVFVRKGPLGNMPDKDPGLPDPRNTGQSIGKLKMGEEERKYMIIQQKEITHTQKVGAFYRTP